MVSSPKNHKVKSTDRQSTEQLDRSGKNRAKLKQDLGALALADVPELCVKLRHVFVFVLDRKDKKKKTKQRGRSCHHLISKHQRGSVRLHCKSVKERRAGPNMQKIQTLGPIQPLTLY